MQNIAIHMISSYLKRTSSNIHDWEDRVVHEMNLFLSVFSIRRLITVNTTQFCIFNNVYLILTESAFVIFFPACLRAFMSSASAALHHFTYDYNIACIRCDSKSSEIKKITKKMYSARQLINFWADLWRKRETIHVLIPTPIEMCFPAINMADPPNLVAVSHFIFNIWFRMAGCFWRRK